MPAPPLSQTESQAEPKTEERLNRTLGLWECVFFGVGSILGAGIYAIVGKAAGHGGNLLWASFLLAAFTAFLSALAYAELSAAFPKAGGEYVYASHAYNRTLAIVLGLLISLNGIISAATVSLAFSGYLSKLLPIGLIPGALGVLGLMALINMIGIRQSSLLNILFTLAEVGGVLFVIYSAWPSLGSVRYTEAPPSGVSGLLLASALSYYAFIGFEDIVKLSEEAKDPQRTIPRALFISGAVVVVLYTLVCFCAVSAVPWQKLSQSSSPLAEIVRGRHGQAGVLAVSIIALFSTSNTILSNMIGSSRVLLEMAGDVRWLKPLAKVWARRKTPLRSLALILIIAMVISLIGKLETIALMANFVIFITFFFMNIAVIVLRRKQPELKRPFRVPLSIRGVPVLSVLGSLLTLLLMGFTVYGLLRGASAR